MARNTRRARPQPPVARPALESGQRHSRAWLAKVLAIGVVALVVRLVYLFELRDSVFLSVLIGDSLQFDTLAQQILARNWSGNEVFYQPQFYPYFLSLVY